MKKIAVTTLAAAIVLSLSATGCGVTTLPSVTESEETAAELGPASPKDDFYRYVNQERFETAEFEYGTSAVMTAFNQKMINDEIEEIIDDVVAGNGYAKGSEEDIIKRAYELYTAYDFENEEIPSDLMAAIEEIDNAKTIDELMEIDAKLIKDYGTGGLLNIAPDTNPFESDKWAIYFYPLSGVMSTSFTSVRDNPYALDDVRSDAGVVLSTRGYDKDTCDQYGTELAYIALDLYTATDMEMAEDDMPYKYYKIYTKDQINEVFTNVDVYAYLANIGFDTSKIDSFCVSDVKQLQALNDIFVEDNLNALKAWELGMLYSQYRIYIAPHYSQLASFVGKDYSSLHDQAITEITNTYSSETDPIYVERYYSEEMDTALRNMCDDIREGYRTLITNADWLTKETRDGLLKKLDNIVYVTGTDLKRHDTAKYKDLVTADNYYKFYLEYQKISTMERINEYGKEISRLDVNMDMQMFNACYQPFYNNITITVAITNAPFFDVNADYYTNLGGLGMVIAHEMGHAFDSTCILFDATGAYNPSWISDVDINILNERNEKAISYFEDNFTFFGVYHVDGELTLGENYADLGAMECITSLATTKEDRMKLFESFATIWCEVCTDEAIIDQVAYDPHSPAIIRVNAVCSTLDSFYETYDIQEGDGMYIAPENRISRWY